MLVTVNGAVPVATFEVSVLATTAPEVTKLPPVTFPVAAITPDAPILPILALPVTFNVPAIFAPVPVTTITLALPATLRLMLPLAAGMFKFELPFETFDTEVMIPVSCEPLPIKKLAAKLPLASRTATVFAVFAVAVLKPSSKSALRFATTVVDVTVSGAVPVAIFETSLDPLMLPVAVRLPVMFKSPGGIVLVLIQAVCALL